MRPDDITKSELQILSSLWTRLQNGEIVREEYRLQRKDGTIFPIDLSISKYKIDNKTYFTGMIRDISDRKNKELLLKKHLDELAHVTRLGLMGEMASGIAHEVNQPLVAIATYSQISLRLLKQDSFDPISLQETLEKIEKQALRAGRIIARMREFISSTTPHPVVNFCSTLYLRLIMSP